MYYLILPIINIPAPPLSNFPSCAPEDIHDKSVTSLQVIFLRLLLSLSVPINILCIYLIRTFKIVGTNLLLGANLYKLLLCQSIVTVSSLSAHIDIYVLTTQFQFWRPPLIYCSAVCQRRLH